MHPLFIAVIVVAVVVGIVLFLRSRTAIESEIQPEDISRLISKLKASGTSPAWAQIIATTDSTTRDSDIALDYSVTNGELEFDWCLLSPKNIADKSILIDFFNKNGFSHTELVAENGCPLIKVSGSNLESLANRILAEIYHLNGPLQLIGDGFEWP